MSAETRLLVDALQIWKLPKGTKFCELGSLGRTFTVGVRSGQLWHGDTPCGVEAVELPVVIL
ncbi:hypothetical protein [Rhodococcus spongiicola]|uniref:Uncharacterized protein n=1 Tax=Rhodococcus spongiicola TaxID=2487352 RepID=A0A3S3BQ20_9NOCA|nr:hypothetical protein [Rhodococcus spongiicola]RVW06531.1 hypothetical protein EF834_03745 [Rhodococcus spongiicola]